MKRILLLSFITYALCISSCGLPPKPSIDVTRLSENYRSEVFFKDTSILSQPSGIACLNGHVVVSDYDSHTLIIFDMDGNCISIIGELGSAPMQFNCPGSMTYFDGILYILDIGNRRIQCLNSDLEYIESIYLWEETQYYQFPYTDIAIAANGDIHVCSGSLNKDRVGVHRIAGKEYEQVYKKFYGFVDSYNGEVFFINAGEIVTKNNITMLDVSGQNHLYSFSDNKKTMLPSSLYSSDFIVTQDSIIVLSFDGSSMIMLNRSGEYVETIADFKIIADDQTNWSINSYIAIDDNGNLYSTNRNAGTIYKVSHK